MRSGLVLILFAALGLAACAQDDADRVAADAADGPRQAAEAAGEKAADMSATASDTVDAAAMDARLAAADPAKGKRIYIFCQACHTIDEAGEAKLGPNLYGIVGQKAAQAEDFVYSDALTNAGITWDAATLDAWIRRPAELVPGTTMIFAGINDEEQRADLIAYLRSAGPE